MLLNAGAGRKLKADIVPQRGGDSDCMGVNAAGSILAATHNAGGKHRREGIVVELKDEGEH
jgi:hypothetical protein